MVFWWIVCEVRGLEVELRLSSESRKREFTCTRVEDEMSSGIAIAGEFFASQLFLISLLSPASEKLGLTSQQPTSTAKVNSSEPCQPHRGNKLQTARLGKA